MSGARGLIEQLFGLAPQNGRRYMSPESPHEPRRLPSVAMASICYSPEAPVTRCVCASHLRLDPWSAKDARQATINNSFPSPPLNIPEDALFVNSGLSRSTLTRTKAISYDFKPQESSIGVPEHAPDVVTATLEADLRDPETNNQFPASLVQLNASPSGQGRIQISTIINPSQQPKPAGGIYQEPLTSSPERKSFASQSCCTWLRAMVRSLPSRSFCW
jgi:hypothetical protein